MRPLKSILLFLISFILTYDAFADSPITSTPFSDAYQNESIIVKASETKGKLTTELMDFLISEANPIDLKVALINELGWDTHKENNPSVFQNYLINKNRYKNEDDFFNNGNGDQLLCMAYLKAMYNYFEVDDAIRYSERALSRNPKSYVFQIISALIRAQKTTFNYSEWCKVYHVTDDVRKDTTLNKDLKEGAISIIFEYMDGYKEFCNKSQNGNK
jgi:hypothetical protein